MGLTVTNTNAMSLLNILSRTEAAQKNVLTQLSTGYKINRGADDPAGLIALKNLQAEIAATDQALANNQRTNAVLGIADNAFSEIGSLLQEIEGLIVASNSDAGLTSSERAANQAQIDNAITAIDRIVNTTAFNGKKLLDGSLGVDTAVADATKVQDLRVFTRSNISSNLTLTVSVTTAANYAVFSAATFSTGVSSGANSLQITGTLGTATIDIATGLSATPTATAINNAKDITGVCAVVSGAGASRKLFLYSTTKGSAAFVSVDVLSGAGGITGASNQFDADGTGGSKQLGTDARGTINGVAFTADGSKVSFNLDGTSGEFTIGSAFTAASSSNFTVKTTGGAIFQLGTSSSTRVTLSLNSIASSRLGGSDVGGFLSNLKSGSTADLSTASSRATALNVVKDAINDMAVIQGRIGGFQKYQVQPAISNLNAAKVGLSDAASVIGDTDYAVATAELNKQSVLLNSGISLLGLANQQAAQILSLLG